MRIIAPRPEDLRDPIIPIPPSPGPNKEGSPGPSSKKNDGAKKKKFDHPFQPMPWISGPAIR